MAQNGRKAASSARRRWVLWTIGAIIAVILLASFASRDDSVLVTAATVSRSAIRSVISTNGKVEPVKNFEAHAPVGTTVKRILVKEGDHVKKGRLLIELDAANARSQAAQALAQVRTSEADMNAMERGGTHEEVLTLNAQMVKASTDRDTAQRNLDALLKLQRSGAASPGEVRAAQDQLATADAQLKLLQSKQKDRFSTPEIVRVKAQHDQAQSAFFAAQNILDQLVVRAPFDGVVYSLPVRLGAYANPGDLILEEADLSKVLIRSFVDEPDVARLATGQKIEVTWDAMPGRVWDGSVSAVPAAVKLHGTRNVGETTCIVTNADYKLLPNINVGVTIVTAQHPDALTVPREALRQDDGAPYVYQIVDNVLQRHTVQTSISNLTRVEITSGVPDHAQVALASINSKPLRDKAPVKVAH